MSCKRGQCQALLADQQDAGRFAVEAVRQFEELGLRALPAQASITPKLTPLPPCTAMPSGLSMTSMKIVLVRGFRQIDARLGRLVGFALRPLRQYGSAECAPCRRSQAIGLHRPAGC
jgi:hypothetical protein